MTGADVAGPRVGLVVNPIGTRALAAQRLLVDRCRELGWPLPLVVATTPDDPGAGAAARLLERGIDLLVVAGGDGTVREVATALVRATSTVPLGVIPTGTANLFAHNLGLPRRDLRRAVDVALGGAGRVGAAAVAVDVGVARVGGAEPQPERVFLVMAGAGYDAETVAATRAGLKRRLGWLAYLEPGLTRMPRPLRPVTVAVDGGPAQEHRAWSVLVGNAGLIPWGIQVISGASMHDGLLDVVVVAPRTPVGWAPILLAGMARRRRRGRGWQHRQATRVVLQAAEPMAVQLDGDVVPAARTVELEVRPGGLLVQVPR